MEKLTKREKVMLGVSIGVSVAAIGVAGYFGFKYYKSELNNKKLNDICNTNSEELRFLKFLIVESDCLPKAKQNGENKLAREENHMKCLLESLAKNPNDKTLQVSYDKHSSKYDNIAHQMSKLYILEDLIANDEDIYSK